ncbi:hypothetical protein ACHAWX_001668 [Stephanocyclus meneghinianus]
MMSSSSSSQSSNDDDKRSKTPRTPSFLQRISSFIDSPCSSYLGIPSSLICASPRSDPTTTASSSSVPVEHRNVVSPIATPDTKAEPISSRRRIQNRSSAPRPIRRRRLDELVNTATIGPRPSSDAVTYVAASSHLSPRSTLRRVRSLQAVSPSSVAAADSSFWAEAADGIDCGPVRDCCPDDRSPIDGGLLSSVGNWCCYDIIAAAATFDNSNRVAPSVQDKCNGYVDYAGVHHPHTDNNCQGCIFRQSLFDGSELIPSAEDLYYDSDCGDIRNQLRRFQIPDVSTSKARRENRTSYPPEDFTQRRRMLAVRNPSPDRRAHLYDYFMRDVNHRIATPLRTGVCATSERDIGDCVQVSDTPKHTWRHRKICPSENFVSINVFYLYDPYHVRRHSIPHGRYHGTLPPPHLTPPPPSLFKPNFVTYGSNEDIAAITTRPSNPVSCGARCDPLSTMPHRHTPLDIPSN